MPKLTRWRLDWSGSGHHTSPAHARRRGDDALTRLMDGPYQLHLSRWTLHPGSTVAGRDHRGGRLGRHRHSTPAHRGGCSAHKAARCAETRGRCGRHRRRSGGRGPQGRDQALANSHANATHLGGRDTGSWQIRLCHGSGDRN